MRITPELRAKLKDPLGEIVTDTSSISSDKLIVCVGDLASTKLISDGFLPKLIVYDGYSKREEIGI